MQSKYDNSFIIKTTFKTGLEGAHKYLNANCTERGVGIMPA